MAISLISFVRVIGSRGDGCTWWPSAASLLWTELPISFDPYLRIYLSRERGPEMMGAARFLDLDVKAGPV
jgi:hypothetical protein